MKKTHSYSDIFFSWYDASTWIDRHIGEHPGWNYKSLLVTFLPSGGFQAEVSFESPRDQLELLYGSTEDA